MKRCQGDLPRSKIVEKDLNPEVETFFESLLELQLIFQSLNLLNFKGQLTGTPISANQDPNSGFYVTTRWDFLKGEHYRFDRPAHDLSGPFPLRSDGKCVLLRLLLIRLYTSDLLLDP